jgi:tripeptidyl-peptidase-1
MYDIPAEYPVHPMSSLCLAEFQNDASYSPDDLQAFNREMFESVSVSQNIGPYTPNPPDGESTLDVQYGGAIALNTTLWFWTVDSWMYEFATQIFDAQPYPLVVSMSWGWPEESQCEVVGCPINSTIYSYDYVKKVNVEFAKLGLMGITLLAASGDQGAPGDDNTLCTTNQISNLFPSSSPWVTSVGATMLVYTHAPRNLTYTQPPLCTQYYCARTKVEGVCTYPNALITSGGGFSNVTALPGWQKQAVLKYLNSGVTLPTGQFDPTKRAYPDVAANGHNYIIHFTGEKTPVDGTSASTPVFGGIIALLNSFMFNNKKQQLGFINPLLYKMSFDDATIFTDITTGNNFCTEQCCTTTGFVATKGWDAVTGLGTPVFSKMQAYIQKVLIKAK